jgi:orotate phosphoribosyltransferase
MKKNDILSLLEEHGALIFGHFEFPSGLHSSAYFRMAMVLQYPHVAHKVAKVLAAKFQVRIDVVVTPGNSSAILGQEVARVLKCRAIFAEREQESIRFGKYFRINRGEKVLIIEDVLTTGHRIAEVATLAQAYGAKILGVGVIVDRSTQKPSFSLPIRSLVSYPLEVWPPDSCPQCLAGTPLTGKSSKAGGGLS